MPENVRVVSEAIFEEEVLGADMPVVVDFWAGWCYPCRMIAPLVEELSREHEGKVKFAKVDVDDNQELAERYNVMEIPTLLVFLNGKLMDRIVGYMPKPELKRRIEAALASQP